MKNKTNVIAFLLLLCSTSLSAQGILGIAFRGFISGFAGAAGEAFFEELVGSRNSIRSNGAYALYPRLEAIEMELASIRKELLALDSRVSHLENQIYLLDQRMTVLESRMDKIEELLPVGSLMLGGGLHTLTGQHNRLLHGEISLLAFNATLGLNFTLDQFEEDGAIPLYRTRNELSNILSHLSFGSTNDPVYLTISPIYTSNFGHSFLFRNYNNDIIFNERQLGLQTGLKHIFGGVEFMSSSLTEERIRTGKAFLRPFALFNNDASFAPVLTTVSYGYARDIVDSLGTRVNFQFADFLLPIVMKAEDGNHFMLNVFGNWASMEDYGSGYGLGVGLETAFSSQGNFVEENGINISKFSAWYEYRQLDPQFATGFFDNFYELDRIATGLSRYEQVINDTIAKVEHYLGGQVDLWRILHVSGYLSRLQSASDADVKTHNYGFRASATLPINFGDNHNRGIWLEGGYAYDVRNAVEVKDIDVSEAINPLDFNRTTAIFAGARINFDQFSIRGEYRVQNYFHQLDEQVFDGNFEKIEYTTVKLGLMYNFSWKD